MIVPLVDLKAQYESIRSEVDEAIARVLEEASFIGGEDHREFEKEFATYCEAEACAAVGNGTDALYLALRALGIGPGDEVITVAHTFIGTAEPITLTGAVPVFVDIDEQTMLLDPEDLERAITVRTRAIVPVHLYGQPCDMDRIHDIARRHRLKVVEDAAQAHGARWSGRRVGALSDATCFSFYPGKNLGAYGDGGAVVSDDRELVQRVRMLANHGRRDKYLHEMQGVNSRLDTLQAAVLRTKLLHLDQWNDARRRHAQSYCAALQHTPVILPVIDPRAESVWHLFVIRVGNREVLGRVLKGQGISTGVHYPVPLHQQPAFDQLHCRRLPISERISCEILTLPLYPELKETAIERIADVIRRCPENVLRPNATGAPSTRMAA
jgi:dTDP-4-amino-4,6-dideoxygalactose transaminase